MADLKAVQDRSRRIFESLLQESGRQPAKAERRGIEATPALAAAESEASSVPARFSVFNPAQAAEATGLALSMSILAAAGPSRADGLDAALTEAEQEAGTRDPELVHHALSMFATHSKDGRRLVKPRTAAAQPRKLAPSSLAAAPDLSLAETAAVAEAAGSTGDEKRLDFWREDPLANEHHEHWHEVYPFSGLFPSDWLQWARQANREGLRELLERLDPPPPDWQSFLATATPEQIRDAFLSRAQALINRGQNLWRQYLNSLSARAFATLFHLNDRHGELFFYMHEQMLARYDAERLSHDLPRVLALSDFSVAIPEGYDPGAALKEFDGFRERLPEQTLADDAAAAMDTNIQALLTAVEDEEFQGTAGNVPITRTNIGDNTEGTVGRLRPQMRNDVYPGIHNFGHNFISDLSEENSDGDRVGVMTSPRTAIRDPVFWRWHKKIDDVGFAWQETQDPYPFADDAPPVVLRPSLDGTPTPWSSPDLILCRTADLPGHEEPDFLTTGGQSLGEEAFGGDAWGQDFTDAEVTLSGGRAFRTTAELTSELKQREIVIDPPPGQSGPPWRGTIDYLTHEPFCYFLRVENPSDRDVSVTVRIFIAPEEEAADSTQERRGWIEMDKFIHRVPTGQRAVIFRPDELSVVIKKPADKDPANLPEPQPGQDDGGSYCECGWPYTLLLPRGTEAGMPFRLLVLLTDAALDQVPQAGHCGSMSFCGAVDRYPDVRDMGYPFSRPFERSIEETFLGLRNAAGRRFAIRRT